MEAQLGKFWGATEKGSTIMFGSGKTTHDVGQQVARYTELKLGIEKLLAESKQHILKSVDEVAPGSDNYETEKQQNIDIIEKLTKVAIEAPDFRFDNYEIFKDFSDYGKIPEKTPYILTAILDSIAAIISEEHRKFGEKKGLHGKELTVYQAETLETLKAVNDAVSKTNDPSKENMQKRISTLLANLVAGRAEQDENANSNLSIIHYLFERPVCSYDNIEPVAQKSTEEHVLTDIVPHACGSDIPEREERLMHLLTARISPTGSSGTAVTEGDAPHSLDFTLKYIEQLKAADESLLDRGRNGKLVNLIAQKLVAYAQTITENAEQYAREKFEEIHSLLRRLDETGVVQYADEGNSLSETFAGVKSNIDTIEQEQRNIARAQDLKVTVRDRFETAAA